MKVLEERMFDKVKCAAEMGEAIVHCLGTQPTRDRLNAIVAYTAYAKDSMTNEEKLLTDGKIEKILLENATLFEMDIAREIWYHLHEIRNTLAPQTV